MIRNIIFDWSGTLVDDLPAVWEATNHVFQKAGVQTLTLPQFRAEFRLPFRHFYERFMPHVPENQLEEWFHGHFLTVQDSVTDLPHARRFLEFCQGRGIRMFVLSTVQEAHFLRQAERLGLRRFFESLYVGVWDKRERIHALLEENRLRVEETLFIGDMAHDVETAHHGGVASCAVLTGYNRLGQLRSSRPTLIVEHLGELLQCLERHDMRLPASPGTALPLTPVPTVGALIFDREDRLLMIQTHKWSDLWGIPGGKIKPGEPSGQALQREIREETGLEIEEIQLVLVQDCIGSEEFYRDAHFLLLNYTCRCARSEPVVLNEEACAHRWVTWKQAMDLPLNQPTRLLLETVGPPGPDRTPSHGAIPHLVTPSQA